MDNRKDKTMDMQERWVAGSVLVAMVLGGITYAETKPSYHSCDWLAGTIIVCDKDDKSFTTRVEAKMIDELLKLRKELSSQGIEEELVGITCLRKWPFVYNCSIVYG